MCGFFVTSRDIANLENLTEFLHHRGPDDTNCLKYRGISFVHTLLSMTGLLTSQPFIDTENGIVALFNGEIYNYLAFGDYDSDGQCILPLYKQHGIDFIPLLGWLE
jgi:asparagine synthetase B (glutamine-hydrolysing)